MLKFFTVCTGGMETLVRYLGVELIDTTTTQTFHLKLMEQCWKPDTETLFYTHLM